MESQEYHSAVAALAWQVELGADECISDAPINRYEAIAEVPKKVAPQAAPVKVQPDAVDPVAEAVAAAQSASDLDALRGALASYQHCDLKNGARNLVFSDGQPGARVMIIGEAPGRDEDREGKPFVGRAGQLLDAMLRAIGHGRSEGAPVYITNVLPWRPPQNRDPNPEEVEMMLPFVQRHIELAKPEVLVLMGNIACGALLGQKGITKLRGNWTDVQNIPALPMFHPAYLLRNPIAKREAWADLLLLQSRLRD